MKTAQKNRRKDIILQGDLSKSSASHVKSQLLKAFEDRSVNCFWLDMKGVNFVVSAGIGTIVTAYSLAKSQGRSLVLCEVNASVRIVFEITGLDQVIPFSDQPLHQPMPILGGEG